MSTYKSLISDFEIVQGDSSAIWFIGLPDNRQLDDGNWKATLILADDFGINRHVTRSLPLNSGNGEGDRHSPNTRFVFQLLPSETKPLQPQKYAVTIEVTNDSLSFNNEIARFKIKVLKGSNETPLNP